MCKADQPVGQIEHDLEKFQIDAPLVLALELQGLLGRVRFITVTDSPDTASISSANWRRRSWYAVLAVAIGLLKSNGDYSGDVLVDKRGGHSSCLLMNWLNGRLRSCLQAN